MGEETPEEVVEPRAKLNRLTEDEGLRYLTQRYNGGWDEPCEVKEGGTGDRVPENLWNVTNLVIVDWESAMNVVVSVEAEQLHDGVKNPSRGERCTNSDPGDVGWNSRAEEAD